MGQTVYLNQMEAELMSIKPEETNLGQYSFKFTPYSKQDHFALCHLANCNGTSKGQVIKMAFHEWLKDNLSKRD